MWNGDSTVEKTLDCRVPFSFFFDLIQTHWRSQAPQSNLALHRVCTLARKQGVTFALVECALGRQVIRDDINDLDNHFGGGGTAQAISFSFFRGEPRDIADIDDADFVGMATVINYKRPGAADYENSYVYEAILAAPHVLDKTGARLNLLNNFIVGDEEFHCLVRGKSFTARGVYFCQQNSRTHVCAHAGLRMTLNSGYPAHTYLTPTEINQNVTFDWRTGGLGLGEIIDTIKRKSGAMPIVVDCGQMNSNDYLTILSSLVESGCLVLMTFHTRDPAVEHVVTVFGYIRNSDEWHPQAVPHYSGAPSAQFYPSNSWIDHYLIHDDNLGPYYTLSARVMESVPSASNQARTVPAAQTDPAIKPHWIIAAHPMAPQVLPSYAQAFTAAILAQSLPSLRNLGVEGRWFPYMANNKWRYVMRSILLSRASYQAHLGELADHDGKTFTAKEIQLTDGLPDWFWMVEFSLPSLFTGNRSKLGEMFVSSVDKGQGIANLLGGRMPGLLTMIDSTGAQKHTKVGVTAHVPYFVAKHHGNTW